MKRTIVFVSVLLLLTAVLSSCSKKGDDSVNETTTRGETYETTAPLYTIGDLQTSEKFELTDNEYHIAYYDVNGAGAKMEIYRDGKLVYYYISSSVDEDGNCIQQKYYTADGEYIGAFDNGYFFDADGQQVSEDVFESELNK